MERLDKDEVVKRLCKLASEVGEVLDVEHDCFCGLNPLSMGRTFQFSNSVLLFIENAVNDKLLKDDLK